MTALLTTLRGSWLIGATTLLSTVLNGAGPSAQAHYVPAPGRPRVGAVSTTLPMSELDEFLRFLTGDFDNRAQVAAQQRAGRQTHPYAKHVTRIVTDRVRGLPTGYRGVFVLEESYYNYPGGDTIRKPYLFHFDLTDEAVPRVRLRSLAIPGRIDKRTFRNANPDWQLAFAELTDSPTFRPAVYTRTDRGYYVKATVALPDQMTFTLEETIGDGFLDVLELVTQAGRRLTPYNTPIRYRRLPPDAGR